LGLALRIEGTENDPRPSLHCGIGGEAGGHGTNRGAAIVSVSAMARASRVSPLLGRARDLSKFEVAMALSAARAVSRIQIRSSRLRPAIHTTTWKTL
jgi:hypothetical protein